MDPKREEALFDRWRRRHVRFFRLHLETLSHHYLSLDTSRVTALYFCIVGLEALREALSAGERQRVIDWVYGMQVVDEATGRGGFRGGTSVEGVAPHIAMTYTALAILVSLGDDLSRVRKDAVAKELKALQRPDGSFTAAADGGEQDARFAYCACAISRLLLLRTTREPFPFDVDELEKHIDACRGHDGGYGLTPHSESHGGSTFCCVAALLLTDRPVDDAVLDWCALRQHATKGGFGGRPNKDPDSCYAFWIGASLRALGAVSLSTLSHSTHSKADVIDACAVTAFVFSCESKILGGFAKYPTEAPPDLLHSFYSICWLSWAYPGNFHAIDPLLGICARHLPSLSD